MADETNQKAEKPVIYGNLKWLLDDARGRLAAGDAGGCVLTDRYQRFYAAHAEYDRLTDRLWWLTKELERLSQERANALAEWASLSDRHASLDNNAEWLKRRADSAERDLAKAASFADEGNVEEAFRILRFYAGTTKTEVR